MKKLILEDATMPEALKKKLLEEAEEDIEISLAAIERRLPEIGKRSSPNTAQDAFGK